MTTIIRDDEEVMTLLCKMAGVKHKEIVNYLAQTFTKIDTFGYASPIWDGGAAIIHDDHFNNFLYDRRSELIFFDFAVGSHEMLMAHLEKIWTYDKTKYGKKKGQIDPDCWEMEEFDSYNAHAKAAGLYLNTGKGFYMSSGYMLMGRIRIHAEHLFTELEETVFGKFPLARVWDQV